MAKVLLIETNVPSGLIQMIKKFYADIRSVFLKKFGIERLCSLGIVIDSFENYPENEWWKKSEYKLIDMSPLKIPKRYDEYNRMLEYFKYAPYLYMKNQTTGEIHLEGVKPVCKDLYDALKMRYDILNLNLINVMNVK